MPDFAQALSLEKLQLRGCIQLRKINPSIGLVRKLNTLNLENCKNLISLPITILGLNSLEYLNVSGCSKLYTNELLDELRIAEHLKKLCLIEAPIHSQSTSSFIKKVFLWPLHLFILEHKETQSAVCCPPLLLSLVCVNLI